LSLPQPQPVSETADAFVLAGGKSSRMGTDKSLLNLNGEPLIQYALEIFRRAGLHARIAGAPCDLSQFAPIIPDHGSASGLGPLAGICSAMSASNSAYAVFLPVDMPLVPAALVTYLLHHAVITKSVVTIASVAGFLQTFPVVIDHAAAPVLQVALGSEDRNCLKAFRAASNALTQPFSVLPLEVLIQAGQISHPAGLPAHAWFHNINSPRDLGAAEAMLLGSTARQVR
jgi:molybdopterin-guanine dinucleotide biosynthesis protein A